MIRENAFMIRAFALICAALALDCFRVSIWGGNPMPLDTHGEAIYIIPGERWSLGSLLQAVGACDLDGLRQRWPLALFALAGAVINIALAVYSAAAEFGFVQSRVAMGAGLLWLTISVLAAFEGYACRLVKSAGAIIRNMEGRK